jgi:hypothetical protein
MRPLQAALLSLIALASTQAQQQFKGEGTFYDLFENAPVACEVPVPSMDIKFMAALNRVQYDQVFKAKCGACARVQGPLGSITVKIVDRCEGCVFGDIDLSREGFGSIAHHDDGRVPITWSFVSCDPVVSLSAPQPVLALPAASMVDPAIPVPQSSVANIKADLPTMQATKPALKTDASAVQSDANAIHSDTTAVQTITPAIQAETTAVQSDTTLAQTATPAIQANTPSPPSASDQKQAAVPNRKSDGYGTTSNKESASADRVSLFSATAILAAFFYFILI